MRNLCLMVLPVLFAFLPSCSVLEKGLEKGAVSIDTTLNTDPGTVSLELKPTTTIDVKPVIPEGAIKFSSNIHTAPITARLVTQAGTFQMSLPLSISSGAVVVTLPVTLNIPPKAVNVELHLEVKEGAVQVAPKVETQVEKGAFDLRWLAFGGIACTILVLLAHWLTHRRVARLERQLAGEKTA